VYNASIIATQLGSVSRAVSSTHAAATGSPMRERPLLNSH
jgi:hypothetical protein